jgi:hypothetical protein
MACFCVRLKKVLLGSTRIFGQAREKRDEGDRVTDVWLEKELR